MYEALQYGTAAVAGIAGLGFVGVAAISAIVRRHQLVASEKRKWLQDHTIIFDKIQRDLQLPLLETMFENGSRIELRKVDSTYLGFTYEHWYIKCGRCCLEFGASEIDLDRARVHINTNDEYANHPGNSEEGVANMTDRIRDRMRHVLGMSNYSLCLRNCEHVANYVFRGRWVSHQMDTNQIIMSFFKTHIASDILGKINSFPASLRPHIFDSDHSRIPVYSFISNGFVASRFEYYLDSSRDEDYNILIVGPSGVGKSRLINVLFNQEICESDISLESVTKEVYFIRGRGKISSKKSRRANERDIVIADTVGLCDQKWDDAKVLSMIKGRIGCNVKHLDAVFILFNANERLPKDFIENVWKILYWLNYPKCQHRFKFIGTKADYLGERKRQELEEQFYRNFKLTKPKDGGNREPVTFVAFPVEQALHGNETTTLKAQQSYNVVREFLHQINQNERILVPGILNDTSCVLL